MSVQLSVQAEALLCFSSCCIIASAAGGRPEHPPFSWGLWVGSNTDCRSFTSCQGKAPLKAETGLATVTAPVSGTDFQVEEGRADSIG